MDKRAQRRKRKNTIRAITDLVRTILLIVIAIAVVGFVYVFVTDRFGGDDNSSKLSMFASVFRRNDEEARDEKDAKNEEGTRESTDPLEESGALPVIQEGLNTDADGRIYFVENGSVVSDCWRDYENCLYHIDENGFVSVSDFQDGAYVYHVSYKGEVISITLSTSAVKETSGTDMPGLVKNGSLMVFLDPQDMLGRFQRIQYKESSVSHALGETSGAEYTLAGSMQIDSDNYIYWLPCVQDPDELEGLINGVLYRRLPGSQQRQFVARGVTGYRIVEGENGKTVIYYSNGTTMFKCGTESCRDDDTVVGFTEDMDYRLQISEDAARLYLVTLSGYPVTKETEAFRTGDMCYGISGEGEIISVSEQKSVLLNGILYMTASDEMYGLKRSVVVRQTGEIKEKISSEFTGECDNLYYCSEDGRIYAEYTFMDGTPHIVTISTDGDVDMLIGGDAEASEARIYGFDEDYVYVKFRKGDIQQFVAIRKTETTPLAVAVEPSLYQEEVETEAETESEEFREELGPGQFSGPGSGSSTSPEETKALGPGSGSQSPGDMSGPGSESQGPGSGSQNPGGGVQGPGSGPGFVEPTTSGNGPGTSF